MTNFAIALHSVITPWTVAVACLILLGISVYYCALEKKARDRADREREARVEDERREHLRQRFAADFAKQRTRETERRMRAADRGAFCASCPDHEACMTGYPCWLVKRAGGAA